MQRYTSNATGKGYEAFHAAVGRLQKQHLANAEGSVTLGFRLFVVSDYWIRLTSHDMPCRHSDTGGGKQPTPIPENEQFYFDWAFSDGTAARATGKGAVV
jgi:hypothetical protein